MNLPEPHPISKILLFFKISKSSKNKFFKKLYVILKLFFSSIWVFLYVFHCLLKFSVNLLSSLIILLHLILFILFLKKFVNLLFSLFNIFNLYHNILKMIK